VKKRNLELVILSDVHLGTFGCRARELWQYLSSIRPKTLVLNGDIIDIWQFRKNYFPKSHLRVIQQVVEMAAEGTEVYYLTGNHDEALRKLSDMRLGNLILEDRAVLPVGDKKVWIFHGDIFDRSIQRAKWLAKLGSFGYDLLIRLNTFTNWVSAKFGGGRYSFSKAIKNGIKSAVDYVNDFEETVANMAIRQKYDYVACGHIHQPKIRKMETKRGTCTYLNSGDWIENLTALEWVKDDWRLYRYREEDYQGFRFDTETLQAVSLERLFQRITKTKLE
jgi:UDP-2,3-diacylglucosamine pyrophosphatase LpxH